MFSDDADLNKKDSLYIEKRSRCLGKYWSHIPALVIKLEKVYDNNETEQYSKTEAMILKSNTITNFRRQCILFLSSLGVT